MTTLAQGVLAYPAVTLAAVAVAVTGPVGLLVALRERGWRPLLAARALWQRR